MELEKSMYHHQIFFDKEEEKIVVYFKINFGKKVQKDAEPEKLVNWRTRYMMDDDPHESRFDILFILLVTNGTRSSLDPKLGVYQVGNG